MPRQRRVCDARGTSARGMTYGMIIYYTGKECPEFLYKNLTYKIIGIAMVSRRRRTCLRHGASGGLEAVYNDALIKQW